MNFYKKLSKSILRPFFLELKRLDFLHIYHSEIGILFIAIKRNNVFSLYDPDKSRFICIGEKRFDRFEKLIVRQLSFHK